MLFISGDYGQIGVYSLPNFMTNIEPSIIDTCELFPKNLCLSLESFTVYEYEIVDRVSHFEQWSNEIEYSKLFNAGLSMMKSEQVCVFKSLENLYVLLCFAFNYTHLYINMRAVQSSRKS